MSSISVTPLKLVDGIHEEAKAVKADEVIETSHYLLKMDETTGAIASLKMRKSGREVLRGSECGDCGEA